MQISQIHFSITGLVGFHDRFFNGFDLKQLESYIRGGEDEEGYPVEGLEGLLERYSQTRNELLELRGE